MHILICLSLPAEGSILSRCPDLKIRQDGHVEYKRSKPGKNLDLNIDLQGFNGDNFDVGFGLVRSTFVVSKPPHRKGGKMKMTVDGKELTRTKQEARRPRGGGDPY